MCMGGPEKWQRSIDSEKWERPIEIEPEKWERPRESVKKWNAFSRTCSELDQSRQRGQVVKQVVHTVGVGNTEDMPLRERTACYTVLVTVEMVNNIQDRESLLKFWEKHRSYLHDNSDGISNKEVVFSKLFSKAVHMDKFGRGGCSESPVVKDKLICLLSGELRWLLASDPSFLSLRCASYLARSLSFIVFSYAKQRGSDAIDELANLVIRWLNVVLKASDFVERLKEDQEIGRRIGLFLQSVGMLGKVYSVEDFRHEIGILQSELVKVDIPGFSLESINDGVHGLLGLSRCGFSIDDRVIDYMQLTLMQVDNNKVHTRGVFTNVVYGLQGFSESGYLIFKDLVTHLMTNLQILEGFLFRDKTHCGKLNLILSRLKKKDGPFTSKLQQDLSSDELKWLLVIHEKCQKISPEILGKLLAVPRDEDIEKYPVSTIIRILEVLAKLDEHDSVSGRMSDRLQSVLLAKAKQSKKFSGDELHSIAESLDLLFDCGIDINSELLKYLQKC